ncbi:MAG TPA: S8 family serine peptidase [Patescibacteria group bacterium]|nr:S8 family serine peptidase [Patescibacteria group bacterium]
MVGAGLLLLTVWLMLGGQPVRAGMEVVIDPLLLEALETAEPGEHLEIIVYTDEAESPIAPDFPEDGLARRIAVAENLKKQGTLALSGVVNQLEREKLQGDVSSIRLLWIVNAVQVTANNEAIDELSSHPDVRLITLDQKIQFLEPKELSLTQAPISLSWGVDIIRSAYAWHGLGVSGQGVTVAIMDTGVDWVHPDLLNNYRGNPGNNDIKHLGNWFDAVDSSVAPIDPNGHGTHVAGTAVGENGIGVAPGAEWIAVRVLDSEGYGKIGDIHAGFQWLLAPDGDPNKSPDLVNNSWSGSTQMIDFMTDISALQSAGIIPIFAVGNRGPFEGSVGAPASYPGTVAVGATDDQDLVAWFSSRGPSPYTADPKPTVVAPGTNILSSLPDGKYGFSLGTSMATPHVVGVYALLLSANPAMSEIEATAIITRTTTTIDLDQPNHVSGWGRVDAYAALSEVAEGGLIEGTVFQDSEPLPGATIVITTPLGIPLVFKSNEDGVFSAHLSPGNYSLKIGNFASTDHYSKEVALIAGDNIRFDVYLEKLPGARLYGQLLDGTTLSPISGTLEIPGTPLVTSVGDDGQYDLSLPLGQFKAIAKSLGHLNDQDLVDIGATDLHQDFYLERAPRILLVDSGNWYYHEKREYISTALAGLDIGFETWPIRDPFLDIPSSEDLAKYDIIVWSAPLDSPGYIGAGSSLTTYLAEGGNLFISGQNVALWDGNPSQPEPWWYSQLKGEFVRKSELPLTIAGEPDTLFAGLELELNGQDSADNQLSVDISQPQTNSFTQVAFRYDDGSPAALQASLCEPYRIVYLGFGLEGVSFASKREEILSRSFDYFAVPANEAGVYLSPGSLDQLVAAGKEHQIDVLITNLSETITDTIQLSLEHAEWPARVITDSLTLGPCQAGQISLSIRVPTDLADDSFDEFELVATSTNSPSNQTVMPIRLKTPGRILVVDDDRWYDQEKQYGDVLDKLGYRYDLWNTDYPPNGNGSPPGTLLNQYEFVIWFTAYDWFQPLTDFETLTLYNYLEAGGRLFLTSQDFLYYHHNEPLTLEYLGIRDYLESVEPNNVFGNLRLGMPVGPLPLDYAPYQNFSDGLVPSPSAEIFAWHDGSGSAAVANSGSDWRTVFWGLPFEKLPLGIQPEAMRQILGWLSDLGDSTFESSSEQSNNLIGEDIFETYTLTLRNSSSDTPDNSTITNTLPPALTIDQDSITGGAIYDPVTRQLSWSGEIAGRGSRTISYRATTAPGLTPGTQINNLVSVLDSRHDLAFERSAPIWVASADLSQSAITISPSAVLPGGLAEIHVDLQNNGDRSATISATIHIAADLTPITPTMSTTDGSVTITEQQLSWGLDLDPHQAAQLTLVVSATNDVRTRWLPATLIIQDGITHPIFKDALLEIKPVQFWLPLMVLADRP